MSYVEDKTREGQGEARQGKVAVRRKNNDNGNYFAKQNQKSGRGSTVSKQAENVAKTIAENGGGEEEKVSVYRANL